MSDNSVLVLGAGELGTAILRGLAGQAAVLLRPSTIASNKPGELRSLGVELVPGDLAEDSVADLAKKFGKFHTVVGCTGFVAGCGTQLKIARAALAGGVKRYVPWQFGVDYDAIGRGSAQDLFDEQLDVRDLLRSQSGTEWVIISTGMFTSFLFEPSFGVVTNDAVHALGRWDNAVTVTTAADIGTLTAKVLRSEHRIANRVVYTAGDTITYGRLADIVEAIRGRKVRREEWTVARLKTELAQAPDDPIKKYRVVFAEGKGVSWPLAGTLNGQEGIAVTGVEQWARENLARARSEDR